MRGLTRAGACPFSVHGKDDVLGTLIGLRVGDSELRD